MLIGAFHSSPRADPIMPLSASLQNMPAHGVTSATNLPRVYQLLGRSFPSWRVVLAECRDVHNAGAIGERDKVAGDNAVGRLVWQNQRAAHTMPASSAPIGLYGLILAAYNRPASTAARMQRIPSNSAST